MPASLHHHRTRHRNITAGAAPRDRPPLSRNLSRRNPYPRPPPGSLTGPPAPDARTLRTFYPVRHPRLPTRPGRPPPASRRQARG